MPRDARHKRFGVPAITGIGTLIALFKVSSVCNNEQEQFFARREAARMLLQAAWSRPQGGHDG